jgi:hypothetical protein
LNFDAPTREECTVNRTTSNTPLQALDLLNDPIYVEAARVFAEHAMPQSDYLGWIFSQALNREPSPEERRILTGLYAANLARFRAAPDDARSLSQIGDSPLPTAVDVPRLAAMTVVTRAVLNLHETITRN